MWCAKQGATKKTRTQNEPKMLESNAPADSELDFNIVRPDNVGFDEQAPTGGRAPNIRDSFRSRQNRAMRLLFCATNNPRQQIVFGMTMVKRTTQLRVPAQFSIANLAAKPRQSLRMATGLPFHVLSSHFGATPDSCGRRPGLDARCLRRHALRPGAGARHARPGDEQGHGGTAEQPDSCWHPGLAALHSDSLLTDWAASAL